MKGETVQSVSWHECSGGADPEGWRVQAGVSAGLRKTSGQSLGLEVGEIWGHCVLLSLGSFVCDFDT